MPKKMTRSELDVLTATWSHNGSVQDALGLWLREHGLISIVEEPTLLQAAKEVCGYLQTGGVTPTDTKGNAWIGAGKLVALMHAIAREESK